MSGPNTLYDPPRGHEQSVGGNSRVAAIQETVNQATNVMHENIVKLSDNQRLTDHLQVKTGEMAQGAGQFRRGANRVMKDMWWKDMKMRMCIILGIVILLIVIIVPSVVYSKKNNS